jgi:hypothetical protein
VTCCREVTVVAKPMLASLLRRWAGVASDAKRVVIMASAAIIGLGQECGFR